MLYYVSINLIDNTINITDGRSSVGSSRSQRIPLGVLSQQVVREPMEHPRQFPQGQPERASRTRALQKQMTAEGFCSCSSNLRVRGRLPQEISAEWISWMHAESRS